MEDSTGMICIDSQFGGKIAPTSNGRGRAEWGEGARKWILRAHTVVNYVCIAAYLVTAIVAAEFGRAR